MDGTAVDQSAPKATRQSVLRHVREAAREAVTGDEIYSLRRLFILNASACAASSVASMSPGMP